MHHIVWLIGALVSLWGFTAVLRPDWMKRMMDFFVVGRRFWAAAAVKVVVGVVLLIFARECRIPWVIILVGILTAGGSLLAMTFKPETVQKFMLWWQKQPFWLFRLWGVAAIIFGGIIIVAGLPASPAA